MNAKNIIDIILSLSFTGLLFSCTAKNEKVTKWDKAFGNSQRLSSSSVCTSDDIMLGRPFLMRYADSSLIVYDDIGDNLFTLIDLADGEKMYRFGKKGEGDNEFLQVFSFSGMLGDTCIGVYDSNRHCLRKINLRQVKQEQEIYPVIADDTLMSLKIFPTKYGTYLGMGFYEKNMLSLSSSDSRRYFYEYPYKDMNEKKIPNRLRGMAYQGNICLNKSLDKFLYVVRTAPIIQIYEITENEIRRTYEWTGAYPEYQTEETAQYRSAPISVENKMAFINAYATNRFIYLLYSGKSFREAKMATFESNTVYQLTWEGKPVRKLELDFPATLICVSNEDDTLYALVNKGEMEIVKYSLR